MNKKALIGLSDQELSLVLANEPSFRIKQLYEFLYAKREKSALSILDCTVLSKQTREKLDAQFTLYSMTEDCKIKDRTGATKYRFKLTDGHFVESVILVDSTGRQTACLSSQVGCKMGCTFCSTAQLGFKRNLTAGEILEQFKWLESDSGNISNIVFMGMGEPLDNLDNVLKAVSILTDEKGFAMGHRRITLSTCGLASALKKLAEAKTGIRLAVSLNNAIDSQREVVMPITKRYSLEELKNALIKYQQETGGKRITLEYVMLKDENMSERHAQAISDFVRGLKAMVNLIPLNAGNSIAHKTPTEAMCAAFERSLKSKRINVTRRYSKGGDIAGACGQLAGKK